MPHAYLEGQNVEIMANSDNVLRGGLTPKHVDVPELLKHVKFEATHARVIGGTEAAGHISVFKTPAPDFELSRIDLLNQESVTIKARSVEIFIVLSGRVDVGEKGSAPFVRAKGESFIAFDGAEVVLTALEDAVVYRAGVPQA
jgi:mannose-6-phosphate isomerase